jgi:lysophospholipase L1-like esterase
VLSNTSPPRVTIDGLAPGEHVVRLEKLTESQHGSDGFSGFWPTNGGRPLPAKAKARRIEFIGDSHTVGYGDTSPRRECTRPEVHDTTNTQLAFGPLLAKRLDMDYRVIAYSGYGVVRNYDGSAPGDSLPKRYPRAIPGEEAPAGSDGWKPAFVVIGLGNNDFSTPLHPGEAWPDQPALHADYRATYVAFVRMLAARYPGARFILLARANFVEDVLDVQRRLGNAAKVEVLPLQELELTGCDWHPSLKDQRAMADQLERAIRNDPASR